MKTMDLCASDTNNYDIVGIDLGTTNSAVSVYTNTTIPTLLQVGKDKFTLPSCVMWLGGDDFIVGEEAYNNRYLSNVCYSIKRMMGSGQTVTLRLESGEERTFTPAEISSQILKKIKEQVAIYFKPVSKCVITVPAYFDQLQINDTLEAAKLAGLDCMQILKEPTSASYIYSQLGYADTGHRLIYDLGGGTFDVTHMLFVRRDAIPSKMLTSLKKQYDIDFSSSNNTDLTDQYFCRVLGTYGDIRLGGDDIDKAMGNELLESSGIKNPSHELRERVYLACETYKKSGFYSQFIVVDGNKFELTQDLLNRAVDKIFEKTMEIIKDIDTSKISSIVLVGGSTKSERLREDLAKAFPDVEISAVLDPDATVALGAGSVAKALANNDTMQYADVLPLPIGVLVDECRVDVCIPKNTSMPYCVSRIYRTLHDNQSIIKVKVYQGLSSKPEQCTYLGCLIVEDIPLAEAGDVEVVLNFILNGQGRLRITSKINGVERPVELIIDNIFSVNDNKSEGSNDSGIASSQLDSFEECMMPLLEGNAEAQDLFAERRKYPEGSKEREAIEDRIAELL